MSVCLSCVNESISLKSTAQVCVIHSVLVVFQHPHTSGDTDSQTFHSGLMQTPETQSGWESLQIQKYSGQAGGSKWHWRRNTIHNNWQCSWSLALFWQSVASFGKSVSYSCLDERYCHQWQWMWFKHLHTLASCLCHGVWTLNQSVRKCHVCTDVTLAITSPSCHRQDTDMRQINHRRN